MLNVKWFVLLLTFILPAEAYAWCSVYTVKKGDTYASISKHYFDDTYYRIYLEKYNKSRELKVGDKVPFFIPRNRYDWYNGCRNVIVSRLTQKHAHSQLEKFTEGIPAAFDGIAALLNEENIDATLAMDLCVLVLAVAEVSTDYGRLPNKKDKFSVYSFDKPVAMEVLKRYGLDEVLQTQKIALKDVMDHVADATLVFVLHFSGLFAQQKSLPKALMKYYNEKDMTLTAMTTYATYMEILSIKPYVCSVEDGKDD